MEVLKKLTKQRENLKDLSEEEAYRIFGDILEGKISPIKIAFFLSAMRIKGDTPEELTGIVKAIKEKAKFPEGSSDIDLALNYDGKNRTLFILPAALWILRESGVSFSTHYAGKVPVKEGVTLPEILVRVGEGINVKWVHQRDLVPSLYALMTLRKELGFRTLINVVEKFLNPFGSKCVIISVFHAPYIEKNARLCEALGFEDYAVIKGLEGGIEPLPDRTTVFKRKGEEVKEFNPEKLGLKLPSSVKSSDPLKDSLELTRRIIKGEERGEFFNWALYTASFILFLSRRVESVEEGIQLLRDTTKM